MGNETIARPIHLPLSDSSFIGDAILKEIDSCQQDKDRLSTAIHQLKEFISSAIQGGDGFDEDWLIECLFSRMDVDYENREHQQVLPLSNGNTYTIRTTEVTDNDKGKEREVESKRPGKAQNPYLVDQEFGRATLCCCKEFLGWVLEIVDNPKVYGFSPVSFPYEMIHNFVQDLSATELISGFCRSTALRERQSFTLSFFVDIENLAFFNHEPNNPTKEMMSIFALRQMLESWFMRIVGFRGVVPLDGIDIRSSRFQKIIENGFEANFKFPPKIRPVTFQSIQRIYKWTQASIHWAYSTNVWLLWKAMTYCERLFGATIELAALENYRTEVIKLCLGKFKSVKATKTNNSQKEPSDKDNKSDNQRTILFRDPDIFVTDRGKRVNSYDVDGEGMSRLERNVIIKKSLNSQ